MSTTINLPGFFLAYPPSSACAPAMISPKATTRSSSICYASLPNLHYSFPASNLWSSSGILSLVNLYLKYSPYHIGNPWGWRSTTPRGWHDAQVDVETVKLLLELVDRGYDLSIVRHSKFDLLTRKIGSLKVIGVSLLWPGYFATMRKWIHTLQKFLSDSDFNSGILNQNLNKPIWEIPKIPTVMLKASTGAMELEFRWQSVVHGQPRLSDAASLSRSLVVCQIETASKYRKFRNGVQLRVAVRSQYCGIDYYFLKSNFVDVHHVPPFYLFA